MLGRRLRFWAVNRGELPGNPLKRMVFRATLRDPDGFGHIGWMIRPDGVIGAAALFGCPAFPKLCFPWGSGE